MLLQLERHSVDGMLELISRERAGEAVSRPLLKSLARMFAALGTYSSALAGPLLEASSRTYHAEGEMLVGQMGVPEYLRHCEVRDELCAPRLCRQSCQPRTADEEAYVCVCFVRGEGTC